MKVDNLHYHCFGCGAHWDAIGYVAQMIGMAQYNAACKIIEDFGLPVEMRTSISEEERNAYREPNVKRKHGIAIQLVLSRI